MNTPRGATRSYFMPRTLRNWGFPLNSLLVIGPQYLLYPSFMALQTWMWVDLSVGPQTAFPSARWGPVPYHTSTARHHRVATRVGPSGGSVWTRSGLAPNLGSRKSAQTFLREHHPAAQSLQLGDTALRLTAQKAKPSRPSSTGNTSQHSRGVPDGSKCCHALPSIATLQVWWLWQTCAAWPLARESCIDTSFCHQSTTEWLMRPLGGCQFLAGSNVPRFTSLPAYLSNVYQSWTEALGIGHPHGHGRASTIRFVSAVVWSCKWGATPKSREGQQATPQSPWGRSQLSHPLRASSRTTRRWDFCGQAQSATSTQKLP